MSEADYGGVPHMNFDAFAVSVEALRRAAAKRIELRPMPSAFSDEICSEVCGCHPTGHYLWLGGYMAAITIKDDFRPAARTYDDLLPGFSVTEIVELPFALEVAENDPVRNSNFVQVRYKRVKGSATGVG